MLPLHNSEYCYLKQATTMKYICQHTLYASLLIPLILTLLAVAETKPRASAHSELCCYNWYYLLTSFIIQDIYLCNFREKYNPPLG